MIIRGVPKQTRQPATWAKIRELEAFIKNDIINKAQVICATCIGAGHPLIADRKFPIVVLDGNPYSLILLL